MTGPAEDGRPGPDADANPWTVRRAEVRYDNRWIRVTHHEVLTPAGTPGIYGTVHFKNLAIGVVPVDDQGHTWLVGQYRFPLGTYSWEIPEGGGPHGVPPLESAARELAEETGLVAAGWLPLLEMDLSNSVSDERAIAYLAWDLTQGAAEPEPTEQLRLRRLPLGAAFGLVRDGSIRDALSVAALQALELRWRDGSLPPAVRERLAPP
ncbi:NUDIX domain-containing protein [Stella sp.]|uniref:NUDIX domain-containing protein n=1 Tax=Stella sp. TaxID=2912054 RepID=UPI0035AE5ABC